MKNTIDVHVAFDYKGESYTPQMTLDLDALMEGDGGFPSVYMLLAKVHGIDTYSYQYEIMQDTDLIFDNAQGLAATCLDNGVFDQAAFVARWRDDQVLGLLQPLVQRELDIADLSEHAGLRSVLLQTYHLGAQSVR